MKIPKSIMLLNREIKIEYNKDLASEHDCLGKTDYYNNKILIDGSEKYAGQREETFIHELIHWILFLMNEDQTNNEKFVELFSRLWHQSSISAKF